MTLRCESCRDSGKPGYVVWPPAGERGRTRFYHPCPDCNGSADTHCCDSLQPQPEKEHP